MIFQDPMTSLNPVLTIGRQIREALETHFGMTRRRPRAAPASCSTWSASRARRAPEGLPAPVLRRHAPAGDDRDGARLRAEAAHRRRADDRARRDDPGADPRAARELAPSGHGADPDHARPRRRRRHVRPRERDVRRACSWRPARRGSSSPSRGTRTRSACSARPPPRRRAQDDAPPIAGAPRDALSAPGVSVRPALPLRGRAVAPGVPRSRRSSPGTWSRASTR